MTRRIAALAITLGLAFAAQAQTTTFTYQGSLAENGSAVTGLQDFEFRLRNAVTGGAQVGSLVTLGDVGVTNGLFTVALDFGANFPGADRFLEISVRPGASTGSYTVLSPRQRITAAPYAVTAGRAQTVDAGTISNPGFVGTTSTAPLDFSVNNQRALRLEYATSGTFGTSPNLIGGYLGNVVSNGFVGAVIGGGGAAGGENRAVNDFATVVGGLGNTASGFASTALGNGTTASGEASTAMGANSIAAGYGSTAIGVGVRASGYASVAMGIQAQALYDYSFVWADDGEDPFASTNGKQFLVRASGGVGIGTNSPKAALHVAGTIKSDVLQADQILGSTAYLHFAETAPKGVAAGQNVIAGPNHRNFNTNIVNSHNLSVSLVNGDIVLPAGTYQCRISTPAYRVDEHQTRLKNATANTILLYGTSEYSDNLAGPLVQSRSEIVGQFTLAAASTIQVQHFTKTEKTVNGLGIPANPFWNDGNPVEVYTIAEFWKIK